MVKQRIITLILLVMLPLTSIANESKVLNQGDLAPYRGFLIPTEKIQELYKTEKERDLLKELYSVDQEIINKQDQSINNLKKEYNKLEKKSKVEKYIYLISGILLTGFVVKITK